jgi:recombination protein RecA
VAKSKEVTGSALEKALATINEQFGAGSILKMGSAHVEVEVIPTGILPLDIALGCGGLPRGRIVELYGPEMAGKSTLALHVVASAQRLGGVCAYVDAEHSLDPEYATAIGVNVDEMFISQPDSGEQALEIVDLLTRTDEVSVIVIDSVAALVPRAELEGSYGDAFVGLHARLMSQALRKLTGVVSKSGTLIIFINQLREKIGVIYGTNEVTTGGRALKFYSSVRLDIRRKEAIKDGDQIVASRTVVKVVKNKVGKPFTTCDFDLEYGKGISREGSILDLAVNDGLVKKSGSWFTYNGENIGQGREKSKLWLADNPDSCTQIEKILREKVA